MNKIFCLFVTIACWSVSCTDHSGPAVHIDSAKAGLSVTDPLPSWNSGHAKTAILEFIRATTDSASAGFVPRAERIASFDLDGTLWVEHPVYTQIMYCIDRIKKLSVGKPALKNQQPFKTLISGNLQQITSFSQKDFDQIAAVALTGMTDELFTADVKAWISGAKDPRWQRPYTELAYQPMLELLAYFRSNGFRTYIVTGSGQDLVRVFSEQVFGIPPEQVIGTAVQTSYVFDSVTRSASLIRNATLTLNDNGPGKPEGIQLIIGRRPYASFGNTPGDRQMLEYAKGGSGARLAMLVLHNDSTREYAYGPAHGLPVTKIGAFPQSLYDEAANSGWFVISMKDDWKTIFNKQTK